jgi:hypothetical protein
VFFFNPIAGFLLSIIGAFFFFTEINTLETISKIFPKQDSQNITGRLQDKEDTARRVVIVAHHDTSKPSLSFSPRLIAYFRASIVLMIISVFLVPVSLGLELFVGSGGILIPLVSPFVLYLLVSVFVLVHRELAYEPVCGANDNASGTGVMLAICETLSENPPENMDVWFLSTGCEEVGAIGMIRFLENHGGALKDAYFINIDNVGRGEIRFTTAEGLIRAFSCSEELVDIASKASAAKDIGAIAFVSKIYPTNTLPCLVRKYRAISILATDEMGLIHNWHWETDTYDKLDEQTIKGAYILVLEMVRLIDTLDTRREHPSQTNIGEMIK